jgi:hypothetical protein
MAKHVKGKLFENYVRMIRKLKHVDWSEHLPASDLEIINQLVLPTQWYPMETFQRCGAAIFEVLAKGDPEKARAWGRISMDQLAKVYKHLLIEPNDQFKTLEKFSKLSRNFFDFDGFGLIVRDENHVAVQIDPAFGTLSVQGYSYQMLGSLERLLELSGAQNVKGEFSEKMWEGARHSVIELRWKIPESA